jgi:hypothetical protein
MDCSINLNWTPILTTDFPFPWLDILILTADASVLLDLDTSILTTDFHVSNGVHGGYDRLCESGGTDVWECRVV